MKFRLSATIFVAGAVLAGCAQTSPALTGVDQYQKDTALCRKEPLTRENAVSQRKCLNEALVNRMVSVGYEPMKLIHKYNQLMSGYAKEYASGWRSQRQYEEAEKKHWNDFVKMEAEIANQRNADSQTASGNYNPVIIFSPMISVPQPIQPIQAPVLKGPTMTNCHTLGNNINCTTW